MKCVLTELLLSFLPADVLQMFCSVASSPGPPLPPKIVNFDPPTPKMPPTLFYPPKFDGFSARGGWRGGWGWPPPPGGFDPRFGGPGGI